MCPPQKWLNSSLSFFHAELWEKTIKQASSLQPSLSSCRIPLEQFVERFWGCNVITEQEPQDLSLPYVKFLDIFRWKMLCSETVHRKSPQRPASGSQVTIKVLPSASHMYLPSFFKVLFTTSTIICGSVVKNMLLEGGGYIIENNTESFVIFLTFIIHQTQFRDSGKELKSLSLKKMLAEIILGIVIPIAPCHVHCYQNGSVKLPCIYSAIFIIHFWHIPCLLPLHRTFIS